MANKIEAHIIALIEAHRISDIHIHTNKPMAARISGELKTFSEYEVDEDDVEEFLGGVLPEDLYEEFMATKDIDFAFQIEGNRFRGSALKTRGGLVVVARVVINKIPNIDDLGLPAAVHKSLMLKDGLVLVTGATGSGKSTSLAAMIDKINRTRAEHIITIEDPIEFIHTPAQSIISQRQVGEDTKTFASALKGALRQDPDVILLGELRDHETISMAITAAETGHLVLSTLHTNGAPETINRLIDAFPADEQAKVRAQLSMSLRLVLSQQLIKKTNGGRIGAFEVMVNTPAVANLIRENKISQISNQMQTSAKDGMVLMEKYKEMLITKGLIEKETTA
jgi:twitching motility protein PilT|tara:strand:+ start:4054 stop:5067 length:1014 start_codon:yes stop_codon:yes gene_type:complete